MSWMIYTRRTVVHASVDQVFGHCISRVGFCQQFPFQIEWLGGPEVWQEGDKLDFRYRACGFWFRHRADVICLERNRRFVDRMTKGFFRHFTHTHDFEASGEGTLVTDTVEFSLGMGELLDRLIGLPILAHTFERRHRALRNCFG